MKSAYLDFQIFSYSSENSDIFNMLKNTNLKYFCSTAHLEELWGAIKNSGQNPENISTVTKLENCITNLCTSGVLNPSYSAIILKDEGIKECLNRIKEYDTRNIIRDNAKILKKHHNKEPNFSEKYNASSEKWKDIWEEDAVIKLLQASNSEHTDEAKFQKLYSDLYRMYGKNEAERHVSRAIESEKQKLVFNCYTTIRKSYAKLETVIEKLSRILSEVGYARDTDIRTFNSGEYDVTHLIYATHCNYFISNDRRLYERALAIYYFLNTQTQVIHWRDFNKSFSVA